MTDSTQSASSPPTSHFKGWAIPGPDVPGGIQPEEGETLDAISGRFRLFQYRDGHRYSTDDVLAAWYGATACPCPRRVLDLGSGIGSVGMIAAWKLPFATFVTVEAQDISVRLARKSARYNGLIDETGSGRYEIREGDFRDPAILADTERFDLVLGSPPYFPLGTGILGDHPQKIACRFEVRGSVVDYCATALKHLASGGVFAGIFPVAQRERVEAGVRDAGGILVRTRDIVFKEGEDPLLFVFLMMRREDLPPALCADPFAEPPLLIRDRSGRVSAEYRTVKLAVGFPP